MARLTSGTTYTSIYKVIECAAAAGVSTMEIEALGLKVTFFPKDTVLQTWGQPSEAPVQPNVGSQEESTGVSTDPAYDKEELERRAREIKEAQLATLAIEDPLAYEELLHNPDRYAALYGNEG